MEQMYLSAELDGGRVLCLAPLTDNQIENSGQEISDSAGYFLFERDSENASRIEIIAKVVSEEAIFRLQQAFNLR